MSETFWGPRFSILFTTMLLPFTTWAWGPVGHGAVGLIAEKAMNAKAKAAVASLLQAQDITQVTTWADSVKHTPGWVHTKPYHFADIPDSTTYLQNLKSLTQEQQILGDVVRALLKAEDILRSPKASTEEKTYALEFMIHFIGDLHQPLHIGRPTDVGGNAIPVSWFGQSTNLHSVWDSGLLGTFLQKSGKPPETSNGSPQDLVSLLRTPTAKEISDWQSSYLPNWLDESFALRTNVYGQDANQSEGYYNQNISFANDRVLKAGYRLASWLNGIFSNVPLSPVAKKFRQDLQNILGPNYADGIVLIESKVPSVHEAALGVWVDPCAHHHHE